MRRSEAGNQTFAEVAYRILKKRRRPLSSTEITSLALSEVMLVSSGKTPAATMRSRLYVDIKEKGNE